MSRPPCPSCPWRVDQDATDIPGFDLDLAERLEGTCDGEFGSPIFACHQSRPSEEFACAGWLAVHGYHSIAVRLMVMGGRVDAEALTPGDGWPALHESFEEVIAKLRTSHLASPAERHGTRADGTPSPSLGGGPPPPVGAAAHPFTAKRPAMPGGPHQPQRRYSPS